MPNETWSAEEWAVYNEDMEADGREAEEERAWAWWEWEGCQSEDHAEQMVYY